MWVDPQLICINEIDLAHRRGQTILLGRAFYYYSISAFESDPTTSFFALTFLHFIPVRLRPKECLNLRISLAQLELRAWVKWGWNITEPRDLFMSFVLLIVEISSSQQ